MRRAIAAHPIPPFVALAYAWTWCWAAPSALGPVDLRAHAMAALGPTVAMLVTSSVCGTTRSDLAHMFGRPRLGRTWLLAGTPVLFGGLGLVASGDPAAVLAAPGGGRLWGWLVPAVCFGLLEEPGWRGFLLPRLQRRHDAAAATWRLWLIWAGWHLPFFTYRFALVTAPVVLGTMWFGAVWLTYLTNSAGGSVLPAVVWHVLYDLVSIVPDQAPFRYSIAVTAPVVVLAVWVGRRYGGEHLAPVGRAVT